MDDHIMGDDAAEHLEMSYSRLHQLAQAGRLGRKWGKHYIFSRDELDRYREMEKDKGGRPRKPRRDLPATREPEAPPVEIPA